MNKKKVAIAAASLTMVGALTVGGTLAYLNSVTETEKNVFTGTNTDLDGFIEETFDQDKASSYLPGDVITKVPTLVNEEDSLEAWVAVKVSFSVDGEAMSYADFTQYATIQTADGNGNMVDGFNTEDFELIETGADYLVFAYQTTLDAGESTTKIFDQVTVDAKIENVTEYYSGSKTVYKEVAEVEEFDLEQDGKYYVVVDTTETAYDSTASYLVSADGEKVEVLAGTKLPGFEVDVQGYMVQAENVEYDTAVTELLALVNAQ